MKLNSAGPEGVRRAGQLIEVPAAEGKLLVAAGAAAPAPNSEVARAEAPAPAVEQRVATKEEKQRRVIG